MNPKIKQLLATIIALIGAYWVAGNLPTEQSYYTRLANLPTNAPLDEVKNIASAVAQASKDADLQFTAQYIYDASDYLHGLGYQRLSDVSTGGVFIRSFVDGFTNPNLMNIWKSFKLWRDSSTFSRDYDLIKARYGGLNYLSILAAGLAAGLAWVSFRPRFVEMEYSLVKTVVSEGNAPSKRLGLDDSVS